MASHVLKGCPICGQAPVVTKYTQYWTFLCERAEHHFVEATGRTRKATAAIWNTRAAETELREALTGVRSVVISKGNVSDSLAIIDAALSNSGASAK